jgi:hypothetical protein
MLKTCKLLNGQEVTPIQALKIQCDSTSSLQYSYCVNVIMDMFEATKEEAEKITDEFIATH